jgi:hypothetical protein
MTPERFRERLEETDGRVDPTEVAEALSYVRGQ